MYKIQKVRIDFVRTDLTILNFSCTALICISSIRRKIGFLEEKKLWAWAWAADRMTVWSPRQRPITHHRTVLENMGQLIGLARNLDIGSNEGPVLFFWFIALRDRPHKILSRAFNPVYTKFWCIHKFCFCFKSIWPNFFFFYWLFLSYFYLFWIFILS